jgi:hypothetical protein
VPVVLSEEEEDDDIGTQTPFCNTALVPQTLFVVVEDDIGTQTPFCNTALVPQTLFVVVDGLEIPKF